MLSPVELNDLFDFLGTPQAGRKLVEKARRLAPVRDVRSNSSNVITRYASRKMDRFVDCESRTGEYAAAIQYEHNPDVLEYYPQPTTIDLLFLDEQGKVTTKSLHTPDFLVISRNGLIVEEWKQEERLAWLSAKYPGRFIKENASWRYPWVEDYFAGLGIEYRLRSALEHPQVFIQNLSFLSDYLDPATPPVAEPEMVAIHSVFEEEPAILLRDLIFRGQVGETHSLLDSMPREIGESQAPLFKADDVFKAIADGAITFDLKRDLLAEAHRAWVYRNISVMRFAACPGQNPETNEPSRAASLEEGAKIEYEGKTFKILIVGEKTVILQGERSIEIELELLAHLFSEGKVTIISRPDHQPAPLEAIRLLAPKAIDQALQRAQWLELAKVNPEAVPRCKRTLERYRAAVRNAGESLADQHLALVSREAQRGNRKRKRTQGTLDQIAIAAKEYFNNPKNMSKLACYAHFVEACKEADVDRCSLRTFNKELETLRSVRAQKGKRMAYQEAPIVWYLKLQEPIHGVRPFQFVHIDHTQLDILVVSRETGKPLGKPWLSLAVDAESRAVLGFFLSWEAPSYRSCMMVIRDIVRRHGRMPEMLVLDNGKEFHSLALSRLCQLYGCSIRYRPGGQPRFGTVMERLFGTTNSEFIHQLEGNTKLLKNPRSLTKSVLPENFACWTLFKLHGALEYFYHKVYGSDPHSAHGEAPLEHFERRMKETGERWVRMVRFDHLFCIESCPSPKDSATRLVLQRGIKVSYLWFWNPVFARADVKKKSLEVRIDPWDPGTAYALLGNEWLQCVSSAGREVSRYTEVERRYAMQEIVKKHGGRQKEMTPERAAEWLHAFDPKNFDPKLSEQQAEMRALYADLGMTVVSGARVIDERPETMNMGEPRRQVRPALGFKSVAPAEAESPAQDMDEASPEPGLLPHANQIPQEELDEYSLF